MRRLAAALFAVIAAACATSERRAESPLAPQGEAAVLRSAELARVRCLLVAPFENGSDAPLAAEAATGALLSGIDPSRTKVFPIPELRGIFKDTPLDLPQGLPPSLALELAELVGADAALWGSIEGRAAGGELLVTMRLSLAGDHQLLFADTAVVRVGSADRAETAIRRAVLEAVRPMLARLGDPGRKRCFDVERIRTLRRFALAETPEAKAAKEAAAAGGVSTSTAAPTPTPTSTATATPSPTPTSTPTATPTATAASTPTAAATAPSAVANATPATPPPGGARAPAARVPAAAGKASAGPGAAPPPAAETRTPRQAEWAKRLAAGGRVLVEDVVFAGRSADLQRDGGLADLAAALRAQPALNVRIEGFVDATSDRAADAKLSAAMAAAAARRLADHGVLKQRIAAEGRGGESPILPNFTARGRTANRRIEVVAVR